MSPSFTALFHLLKVHRSGLTYYHHFVDVGPVFFLPLLRKFEREACCEWAAFRWQSILAVQGTSAGQGTTQGFSWAGTSRRQRSGMNLASEKERKGQITRFVVLCS